MSEFNLNEKLKELEEEYDMVEEDNGVDKNLQRQNDYFALIDRKLDQYSKFLDQKNKALIQQKATQEKQRADNKKFK